MHNLHSNNIIRNDCVNCLQSLSHKACKLVHHLILWRSNVYASKVIAPDSHRRLDALGAMCMLCVHMCFKVPKLLCVATHNIYEKINSCRENYCLLVAQAHIKSAWLPAPRSTHTGGPQEHQVFCVVRCAWISVRCMHGIALCWAETWFTSHTNMH